MELDVHLKREGEESWGFRLIGGKDFKMPLTVAKVESNSPAARAGLQNGDTVCFFNGVDASEMSHDSAKQFVADATDTLELGVKRGLYDPVLDDFEPIYEPIDQGDFDQPSPPTEVDPFAIQQFQDPKQPSRETSDLKDIEPGLNFVTNGLGQDPNNVFTPLTNGLGPDLTRSLTASPFVVPIKPYRPFSTEPVPEIPALEDPIILNPNYKDLFGKLDDGGEFGGLPETRFKLPISEQYDPDGTKKKRERAASEFKGVTFADSVKTDVVMKESKVSEEVKMKTALEDKMYMETMKKEIDLDKIEMTAVSLVNESIERAVSVTDEIKKEIDVELHESSVATDKVEQSVKESSKTAIGITVLQSEHTEMASTKTSVDITASESLQETAKSVKKSSKEASELVSLIDQTTEEIITYNESKADVSVSKEVEKFETLDKNQKVVDERKLSTKQEIEEVIETGSVRRKSEVFDKKLDVKSEESSQKVDKAKSVQQVEVEEVKANKEAVKAETVSQSARKISDVKKEVVSSQKSEAKLSDTKSTTTRQSAEQKAYIIGLQTIPNIKGTVHSSYHYNLLLKTFFIHLTDVMVALSRFILTEPVFNKAEESQEVKEVVNKQSVSEYKGEYVKEETFVDDKQEKHMARKESTVNEAKQELYESKKEEKAEVFKEKVEKQEAVVSTVHKIADKILVEERNCAEDIQANLEVEEIIEKQKLSGAQMAQVQERKSAELTQKMDAVISEFQTKAGIEETEVVKERRSRSRSQIEEEMSRESDPLEWLSKVDQKKSQEITEMKSESKSYSSTAESVEKKRVELKHERLEQSSKSKEGKQMYVAIVESHVFTNKDAIFEEQAAEFSETSSVQSAEQTNIALQASETVATEQVSVEAKKIKQEVAESVLEESREVSIVNAQKQSVQIAEAVTESNTVVEEIKEEKAIEIKEEKSIEIKKEKAIEIKEEIATEIKEETAVQVQEEIHKVEVKEEHITAASQKTETDITEKHESIDVQETKHEEYAAIKTEESTALEVTEDKVAEVKTKEIEEVAPVETVVLKLPQPALMPTMEEESAALKIVKEEVIEREQVLKLAEETELNISKHTEISAMESQHTEVHKNQMETHESKAIIQEASFTGSLAHQKQSMTLDLSQERKLETQLSSSSVASTIDTPTPSTIPPTPLTDEYVFKLHIPLPKTTGAPIPRDCTPTPEDEDPNIVKKKLIPYIDTNLESPVIYDPPLPTPPADQVSSPVYSKPGLKGGSQRFYGGFLASKEEILEIERKSSLLASAIDETIKSIEEYKEEVGIDKETFKEKNQVEQSTKTFEQHTVSEKVQSDQPIIYNGYAKVETKVYNNIDSKIDEEWNKIDKQVKDTTEKFNQLSNRFQIQENGVENGILNGVASDTENSVDSVITQKSIEHDNTAISIEAKPVFGAEKSVAVETSTVKAMELDNTIINEPTKIAEPISLANGTNGVQPSTFEQSNGVTANFDIINNGINTKSYEEVGKYTIKASDDVVAAEKPGDVSAAFIIETKKDPMEKYRPVQFNPEELVAARKGLQSIHLSVQEPMQRAQSPSYVSSTGEPLGTHQGIVDGLEEAVVDNEVAKELGKPGMTEQKIAELISGESEMLREAHVMGLSRVLKSHMHRTEDDSSVDFKRIKPIIESLKDSEVLKALNDELIRTAEEKKREEEKKWTTFLQKPKRPVPRAKFGYPGYVQEEEKVEEPYKVKIVKQPKPKVAPDYKPKDFNTGPLPWEERALNEPPPPPVEAEDPILIPEEVPEFLEAVDPLPESEVPDLEETGIPLPPPTPEKEPSPEPEEEPGQPEVEEEEAEELDLEAVVEETNQIVGEMEQNRLVEQLMMGVQSMVDPNASIDQQLAQMRAQVAALAQLPGVIQQTLDLVTRQLSQLSQQETYQITEVPETQSQSEMKSESHEYVEATQNNCESVQEESNSVPESHQNGEMNEQPTIVEVVEETKPSLTQEELEKLRREEEEMLEEQRRIEKQKKELMEQMRLEQESRQVKQRPTPRVGKPKPVFGPAEPQARPLVLPGGRRWRKPADAYNEAFIAETLSAQAEIIQGKAKGLSYESDILPYDERINFMKYEKPPVSLDHLQHSDVYKMIHNMEQEPLKRVEMRTPCMAEADYREKCRSMTPCADRLTYPQQVHP